MTIKDKKRFLPNWFYTLSHHSIQELDHSILLGYSKSGVPIALCSRCFGIYLGVILGIINEIFYGFYLLPTTVYLIALLPLLLFLDWGKQCFSSYKSDNGLRFISGTLLGFAIPLSITYQFYNLLIGSVYGFFPLLIIMGYGVIRYYISKNRTTPKIKVESNEEL